jgi:VanZ family protein
MSENVERVLEAPSSLSRKLFYWLPPLLWMAAIFWFSTDVFSANHTGSVLETLLRWFDPELTRAQVKLIHFSLRKAAHFSVYAVLALLLLRAFRAGSPARWRLRWALYSFFIISIYALLDEYHQAFSSERTAAISDSLIDMAGGLLTLCVLGLASWRESLRIRV